MSASDPAASLTLAKKHLVRVLQSWDPPQWLDLSAYALYALEAATVAAGLHVGTTLKRTHWNKAEVARTLARDHELPDIAPLMADLNEVRKSEAYGDIASPPTLDPETVARRVEDYVQAVHDLLTRE